MSAPPFDQPASSDEEELFRAAVAQGSMEAGRDFLDHACRGSPELRERLDRMLEAHFSAHGFLRSVPPGKPDQSRSLTRSHALEDESELGAGRYRLRERLGEGGFGEVWLADELFPFKRQVAVKLIKPGMDSRQVVARFEAERQALALMDHPYIARVFDGGTSPSGRLFFVMELVSGLRITEFCARHQLTLKQRLELFISVCQAVQHAHQKGVVHRDLKPGNILVAHQDGVPRPKVIDFGIAKALQGELTDQTLQTQVQQFLGTPAYCSPEQANGGGQDIDTRSDIYSLGVLLYELLTGQTPFDTRQLLASGFDELRRTIRDREPERPSTRLARLASDPSPGPHAGTWPPTSAIPEDLDWVVMKCLEKDRTRRYATVNGLAADLERHLANEPVVARPPSRAYRLHKAWRRNRLTFTVTGVVLVAILGSLTAVAWYSMRFARQQAQAAATLQANLANEYLRRGQSLCLEGKVTEGLHWLARSLSQAPSQSTGLVAVARQNLGGWSATHNRPLATFTQNSLLYAADYHPSQDLVALGGMEDAVQLYNATSGEPVGPRLPQGTTVRKTLFSPDGRFLATLDVRAWLWHANGGSLLLGPLGNTNRVEAVDFSPDSQQLAIVGAGGLAQRWSTESGRLLGVLEPQPAAVVAVKFSPDGQLLGTADQAGAVRLWKASSGEPLGQVLQHDEPLTQLQFSPDGKTLATVGTNRTVWLWSVREGVSAAPPLRHPGIVRFVAFSPDHLRVLAGGEDGTAQLWNLAGEPVGSPLLHAGGVLCGTFSPDGEWVVTGGRDRAARFWSAATGQPLGLPLEHDGWVAEIHFNGDGSRILTRTYGHSAVVWSTRVAAAPALELHEQPLLAGVFSPDGHTVLTVNIQGEARLWNADTGQPTGQVVRHRSFNAAFSPDGTSFLTAGTDGQVKLWSTADARPLGAPLVHPTTLRAAVFSHDGSRIATASFDRTARLWSVASREEISPPLVHPKIVEDVAFSPDDTRLVTAGSDGQARVWSVATGKLVLPPLEHRSAVLGVAFSPDGRWIATASRDATARLWDAATGREAGAPMQHPDWVEEIVFSPDSRTLLTASNDGQARWWSVATGHLLGPPVMTAGPLMDVEFSPDGRRGLASSQARAFWVAQAPTFHGAKLWQFPLPYDGPIDQAEAWVESLTGRRLDGRGVMSWLTAAEWAARQREFAAGSTSRVKESSGAR